MRQAALCIIGLGVNVASTAGRILAGSAGSLTACAGGPAGEPDLLGWPAPDPLVRELGKVEHPPLPGPPSSISRPALTICTGPSSRTSNEEVPPTASRPSMDTRKGSASTPAPASPNSSACGVPLAARDADYPVRGAAAAAAARAPGMVSRWARLETAQRGTVRVKVLWCIPGGRGVAVSSGRPSGTGCLRMSARPGYQRRAASVNAALIAERMAGIAVASLMGCDGFSASTVTT